MTAVSALFRRGSVYTIATAVQLSVFVLVLPLLTRLLARDEFGRVAAALVVTQLLTYVASLGMPYAITMEYFEDPASAAGPRALLFTATFVAAAIAAAAHLSGPYWTAATFRELTYDGPLQLAVVATLPFAVLLAGQALLRSSNRVVGFVAATTVATIGAQLGGAIGAVVGGRTATSFMAGYVVVLAIGGGLAFVLAGVDFSRVTDWRLQGRALALGLPTVPHALAIYVIAAGDRVIVERHLGVDAVASYHVAYLVGALGITLAGAVNNAWGPIIYAEKPPQRWVVLADTEAVLTKLGGSIAAGLALGAPFALLVFAPSSYRPLTMSATSAIVAFSTMPYLEYLANGHVIMAERRAWLLAFMTPAAAGTNVMLNLALVPHIGLRGAALSTVGAYLLLGGMALVARRRVIDGGRKWRALGGGWAVAAAGAVAGAALPTAGAWLVVRFVLVACLAGLIFREIRRSVTGGALGRR